MAARALPAQQAYEPALINVAGEAVLLGALMIDNAIVPTIADKLAPADFFDPLHQQIFEAITLRIDSGKSATPVTLRSLFEGDAVAYLSELTANSSGVFAARELADEVQKLSRYRRAVDQVRATLEALNRPADSSLEDIVSGFDGAMTSALGLEQADSSCSLGDASRAALNRADEEARGVRPAGIQSATLHDWNEIAAPMRPGDLIILAGRPGMGKTTVGLNVACGVAANDHGVLFVSLEMDHEDLGLKAAADLSYEHGISPTFDQIESGDLTREDWRRLNEAQRRMSEWAFDIHYPGSIKIGRLGSVVRRFQRKHAAAGKQLKLVVVDYLQLVQPDEKHDSIYGGVSAVTKGLKRLARELGVVILALAQPNRDCEKRPNKRPFMFDLRDSGQIEQDADKVVFLYREEYYLKREEPDPADEIKHSAWQTSMRACANRLEIYTDKVRKGRGGKRVCFFFAGAQAVRGSGFFDDRRFA